MAIGFKKATKQQAFLRMGIYGPSGGGKTFSSLRIATGIQRVVGGRIAFICSERGAASKYADRFDFDVVDLEQRTVDDYIEAIDLARKAGFKVLIIDSTSHAWQEILDSIDEIAKARFKGNRWSAWSEATPKQKAFVDAILHYPGHVIGTMRAKTEWDTEKDSKKPIRIGLSPEQGKNIEYEYDLLMSITADHIALIEKDRTGKFQDKIVTKPGEDFGEELARWLLVGEAPAPALPSADELRRDIGIELDRLCGDDAKERKRRVEELFAAPPRTPDEMAQVLTYLRDIPGPGDAHETDNVLADGAASKA